MIIALYIERKQTWRDPWDEVLSLAQCGEGSGCSNNVRGPLLGYSPQWYAMVVETLNVPRHTWSPLVFAACTTSGVNEFYKLTTSCAKQ